MKTLSATNKLFQVKTIALIGVMTAVTCVLAPLSIPIGPVPISLTNLVIYFSIYLLGMRDATISYLVYLLIGLIGLPVFSGGTGGAAKLFGSTGGYLIGFIPMTIVAGIFISRFSDKWYLCFAGMILGTAICYAFGTIWLAYLGDMDFMAALWAGVIKFIPGDLIKMILALLFAPEIRKRLRQAHVLD